MRSRSAALLALAAVVTTSGAAAFEPAYPLEASLRGPHPIQASGALIVSGLQDSPATGFLEVAPGAPEDNRTLISGEHFTYRFQTLSSNYVLPGGVTQPGPAGPGPAQEATNAVLKLVEAHAFPQFAISFSPIPPRGELNASANECSVRHPLPGDAIPFPDDPAVNPYGPALAPVYRQLVAQCSIANATFDTPSRIRVWGLDLWLEADGVSELLRTGTYNETNENGLPMEVARELWVELPRTEYRFDLPHPANMTFYSQDFLTLGTLSLGPTEGNLSWGALEARGAVQPFNATGTVAMSWAENEFIALSGATTNPPGPAAEGAVPDVGALPTLALVAVVAVSAVALSPWLYWWLFSKIAPQRVLDHPRRLAILDYVRAEPGVETNTVCRTLGLHWVAAQHHIRTLQRAGHLSLSRVGGRTALFPAKAGFRGREVRVAVLRRESARRLLGAIREAPGTDQATLAARLGLTRQGVSKGLRILVQAGLVRAVEGGPARQYFATDGDSSAAATRL